MTTAGKDQDIARLQEENAALQRKLEKVKQRKQEKAARKAHAKLAKLQEQLQTVTAVKAAKETRAGRSPYAMFKTHAAFFTNTYSACTLLLPGSRSRSVLK